LNGLRRTRRAATSASRSSVGECRPDGRRVDGGAGLIRDVDIQGLQLIDVDTSNTKIGNVDPNHEFLAH
jgi:hypothetical protein